MKCKDVKKCVNARLQWARTQSCFEKAAERREGEPPISLKSSLEKCRIAAGWEASLEVMSKLS